MLVEAEKLRWLGVDMRARWRRRVAVVGTYAVFVAAVWSPSERVWGAAWSLLMFSLVLPIWSELMDVDVWMQWLGKAFVVLLGGYFVWHSWHAWFVPRKADGGSVGVFLLMLLVSKSVLGWNMLVDSGDRGWASVAIRNHTKLGWWGRRRLARLGFAVGLEGFAWYEYGMRYKKLDAEQKAEIEAMSRANPHGKWMRQRDGVLFDDERMRNEENRLRARVQRVMTWVLAGAALIASIVLADGGVVHAETVVASLWTLAGLAMTLRQAIPLWAEADPREMCGELAVVGGVEA